VFEQNLKTMAQVFRRYANPPLVRYITMAFKSNLNEIPTIVRETHEKYLAYENEIRYTYNVQHIADEFRRQHYLHKEDWNELDQKLRRVPYRYGIAFPPENGYEETIQPSANYFDIQPNLFPPTPISLPFALRGRHDGTLMVEFHEQQFRVNANSCEDLVGFFKNLSGP